MTGAPILLRSPLVHFLLLGALGFAARDRIGELARAAIAKPPLVTLEADRIDGLRRGWQAQMGRVPTQAELAALIGDEVDDELLYREALARGLDEGDPEIALRLVQKMTFLDDAAAGADPGALVREARALGLERDDPVVRRLLVQKLRLAATALAPDERPSEADLARAHAARSESLREPERRSLVHVFASRDRRGARTEADAAALRERIEREAIPPALAIRQGDAFPLGLHLDPQTRDELARGFGEGFARAVFAEAPGQWSQPIESAYGLHLVRVERVLPGALPPLETVRTSLRLALEEEARDRKLAALLAELRTRYEVAVAQPGEERE
ncbi:MAG: peptidyl-prolyl cis-trans isomerase [Myxococcota bacterium]